MARNLDRVYRWDSTGAALTFQCDRCGHDIDGEHIRAEIHTYVRGQRIGRTLFYHIACVPDDMPVPA